MEVALWQKNVKSVENKEYLVIQYLSHIKEVIDLGLLT